MPNEKPAVVAQEPSPLEVAVRDRSWEWLLELRRRLKVDLLLVDGRLTALLPNIPGDQPAHAVAMLERAEPTLLNGITDAMKERLPQVLELEGLQIACVPVGATNAVSGVLLIGRPLSARQQAASARSQLELVGSWLSTAIEAHLQGPPAFQASGVSRIGPLAQLLGHASERESDRELIRLFGEAIAVWHDIEVCSYAETQSGSFVRDVMLPGARMGERPAVISAIGLPESTDLTRLPQGHLDRFGSVTSDVFVKRFRNGGEGSWLLVFTGAIDAYDLQRLGAYVSLLELALSLSTVTMAAKVSTAVARHLVGLSGSVEGHVLRALEELRTTVGAASATVTFGDAKGALLRAVSPPGAADSELSPTTFRVVLVKRAERHYTTTVTLGRHESLPFTPRDNVVVTSAVEAFGLWAPTAFGSASGRRERRATSRGFRELLERSAKEAIDGGSRIAVVVLVVRDGARRHSTQQWVAGIRGMMRASDLAGMLGEGEIGLLMRDTEADQAKHVAERLRAAVDATPSPESVLIGVAARYPDQGSAEGIVHDARANAVAGGRGPASSHGVTR